MTNAAAGQFFGPKFSAHKTQPDLAFRNFEERFNTNVEAMQKSKASCKSMFDDHLTFSLGLAMKPREEIEMRESNLKSNNNRKRR